MDEIIRVTGSTQNKITEGVFEDMVREKNKEIEDLKYQLRLHKKLISHIFREYQIVRGLKAVDILA